MKQGPRGESVKRKTSGDELERVSHDLRERVKELNFLYGISNLLERPGISLEEIIKGTLRILPAALQYPEVTCGRITLDDQVFKTKDFKETTWKLVSDILVNDQNMGTLEVFYKEERPPSHEGPFLKEERKLIDAVAEKLGKIIWIKLAEKSLKESEERYRVLAEQERERLLQFRDERERLRALMDLREDPFHTFAVCEVIGRSPSPFIQSVTIDRGAADSVRVGMAVVGYRGLVGRVSQVFSRTAEVILISHKSISVSCVTRRSRVVGILEWDRSNLFRLEYVGKEEDVLVGDTLITSGYGELFPRGFLVGTVFQVSDERGGIAKRVRVASLANLNALEELFIVTGTRGWRDNRLYDELEALESRGPGRR